MTVSQDALIVDPLFPELKDYVIKSTGLAYYRDKDADLARRLQRRFEIANVPDCRAYLAILRDPREGVAERDALIAEITIGETYFFRHLEHFDALRDRVLPEILSGNTAKRSLRIWCAGCADGPEPYSLAILLKRQMANQVAGWDVNILGTDLNRQSLAKAREGTFEEWAFRTTPEEIKRACFTREGRFWKIAKEYKDWVFFQFHNLAEDSFPSLLNNLSAFDVIICRNVMIYFGPDQMCKIIQQFYDSLVPGGWLVVGPSEPNMTCFTSFRTVNAPGVTLYQKPYLETGSTREPDVPFAASQPTLSPVPPACNPVPSPAESAPIPTLEDIRHYADIGAWEEASRCCQALLEKDGFSARVYFHHALVLEQMSKHLEAESALKRAIYLDRQAVLAHYYLGLFLQARGDPKQAAKSFENTLDLLNCRPDTDSFSDADGITSAELKRLAAMHLEILGEHA